MNKAEVVPDKDAYRAHMIEEFKSFFANDFDFKSDFTYEDLMNALLETECTIPEVVACHRYAIMYLMAHLLYLKRKATVTMVSIDDVESITLDKMSLSMKRGTKLERKDVHGAGFTFEKTKYGLRYLEILSGAKENVVSAAEAGAVYVVTGSSLPPSGYSTNLSDLKFELWKD